MKATHERIRVLSVTGGGRSGSTILGNILGQVPGFFHGGELCYLWNRGVGQNALCGCGAPFNQCPVWTEVMADEAVASFAADRRRLERFPRTANRHLPLIMLNPRLSNRIVEDAALYARQLIALYRAIRRVTGSRVILDSSKTPSHVHVLTSLDGIDLRVVHLVRDPRAVAHSWHRKLVRHDLGDDRPRPMARTSIARGALKWAYSNALIDASTRGMPRSRFILLRFEDFVRKPAATASAIAMFAGADEAALPFSSDRDITLNPTHTVWGNPSRLKVGRVELRADDAWRSRMQSSDRFMVTALTWPLLLRYGYPLVGR